MGLRIEKKWILYNSTDNCVWEWETLRINLTHLSTDDIRHRIEEEQSR